MTPSDISLTCSLSGEQKDTLVNNGAFRTMREGMPFTDDDMLSDPRESAMLAVTARCHMFNLSEEQQRNAYADLISKIQVGDCVERVWEEHVTTDKGLVIYITVLEYAQITKKTLDRIQND